jgi:pyruvate-formate lyase-activating enzyme
MEPCPTPHQKSLDVSHLYRMPWTNSDNAFSWLEITRRCDLKCGYCYQSNDPGSDMTMAEIEAELSALLKLRTCDTMFVSGGEPLLHPKLDIIVRRVKSHGVKPVLVTNGHRLTRDRIQQLKAAGLFGFILHVDREQSRPGWTGKSELALNELRQHYADMIHKEKGLICGFNTTILPETLHEVADIVRWTIRNIDKVCTNCLIPVRVPKKEDPWEYSVRGKSISFEDTVFAEKPYKNPSNTLLSAADIYGQVLKVLPGFTGNAFLGGTEIPNAPKWLFSNIIGTSQDTFGCLGPKSMEMLQNGFHFARNRFLSFLPPKLYARAKWLFPLAVVDKKLRRALSSFAKTLFKNPSLLFQKVSIQSLLILQPQDVLPNGAQDLCDGCPNRTAHNGRLIPMCRKEEYLRFGDTVTLKTKSEAGRNVSGQQPAVLAM